MADDRKYSQDEVDAILRRALERKELEAGVSHGELIETAKEIGIAPADLEHAIVADRKEREIAAERELWIDRRRARLRQAVVTWLSVNGICFGINMLTTPQTLWFLWVLVPWGLLLAMLAALFRSGPTPAQLESQRDRRQRKLRRAARRQQWKKGAHALEAVVEEGVNALVARLEQHRKQLGDGPDRHRDRLSSPADLDSTRPDKPRTRRDD